jgi:hypothetical protein
MIDETVIESYFEHQTDNFEILICTDRNRDGKLIGFQMSFEKFFRGEVVKEFFSARPLIAGEWLRDEIGYGPAKDALEAMNIPKDVPIWKLGQKG